MNKRSAIYLPVLIAISVVIGIFLGNTLDNSQPTVLRNFPYQNNNKLSTIIDLISSSYVDSISTDKLIEETIPELMSKLDPHSTYIQARDMQEVNEEMQGNFGGIGVQFSIIQDTIQVIDVISGGPSQKLGIMAGDRIVTVGDSIIAGVGIVNDDVLKLLRGEKGSKVNVGIKRKGISDLIQYEITRGDIPIISVDVDYMIDKTTGYVKVSRFAENTYAEFMDAVEELDYLGAEKVIIDLRGNPGGYLMSVIQMVNEFMNEGETIVYTEGYSQQRQNYTATSRGKWVDKEVFVLIDEYSASASEIFAGAIQDNDRGVIIGRRSFGKGLVQEQIPFNDGSAIRLTVARYYTPSGRSIQKPYENGDSDEYYQDIVNRAIHGEFLDADSIQFADSLKYETLSGRIVYGGGGIMPDYFIPADTTGYSDYYSKITQRQMVYYYAFEYTDNNRDALNKLQTPAEFISYLTNDNILEKFISYAEGEGVKRNNADLEISGEVIETQLMAYISRNIIGDKGFYPVVQRIDKTLMQAIQISNSEDSIEKLLAVTK